jgi:hypothetical protein
MSIIYKGILNGGAGIDSDGKATTTRTLVYYFNAGESPVKILKQTEIPKLGTVHPDNETLRLTGISVSDPMEGDEVKSAKYHVVLTYTRTRENVENKNNQNGPPWSLPPYDISYSPNEYVVAFRQGYVDGDKNGSPTDAVLNSAGDPFEESTTRQNLILKFTYNLQTFTPSWIVDYMDTINQKDINILDIAIPAYKGRIKSLAASKQKDYTAEGLRRYSYWIINVEIEISKSFWRQDIMQRGLFFLKDIGGGTMQKERIYKRTDGETGDNFGAMEDVGTDPIPCDEPQRLNAAGGLLDPTGSATVNSVFIDFWDKYDCDWSPLNLPQTAQMSIGLNISSGGTGI